jgi:hypothetical protein
MSIAGQSALRIDEGQFRRTICLKKEPCPLFHFFSVGFFITGKFGQPPVDMRLNLLDKVI